MNQSAKETNVRVCRKIYDQINNTLFNGRIKEDYNIEIDKIWGKGNVNMTFSPNSPTLRFSEALFTPEHIREVLMGMIEFASIRFVSLNKLPVGLSNPRLYKGKAFKDVIQRHGIVMSDKLSNRGYVILGMRKCYEHIWNDNKKNFVFNGTDDACALVPITSTAITKVSSSVPSSMRTFKYICPKCNHTLITTNQSKLICGDCFTRMMEEENNNG